jgi:high-affinity Fe2+/Pb2+ permease
VVVRIKRSFPTRVAPPAVEPARVGIAAALIVALVAIWFITAGNVDADGQVEAYTEGAFRALIAVGIAGALYIGSRAFD